MSVVDRLLAAVRTVAAGSTPGIDYRNTYRSVLLRQLANLRRVDIQPSDPRLPPMSNVPLKLGVPGVDVVINPGHFVLLGWEDGRPDRPYVTLWDPGESGTLPDRLVFRAAQVHLGDDCTLPMDGVLTGESIDTASGLKQWMLGNASARVGAKKI